jgi:hypothetical protein
MQALRPRLGQPHPYRVAGCTLRRRWADQPAIGQRMLLTLDTAENQLSHISPNPVALLLPLTAEATNGNKHPKIDSGTPGSK